MDPFALGMIVGIVLSALLVSVVLVPLVIVHGIQRDRTPVVAARQEMPTRSAGAPEKDATPARAVEEPDPRPDPAPEYAPLCTSCRRPHDANSLVVVDDGTTKLRRYTCPHCGHVDSLPE